MGRVFDQIMVGNELLLCSESHHYQPDMVAAPLPGGQAPEEKEAKDYGRGEEGESPQRQTTI